MKEFEGKIALVTGGNSGIGLEIVKLFIQKKMKVIILSNEKTDGIALAEIIKNSGGQALFIECDIKSELDIEHAVNTGVEKFGRIDIAVNSAGIPSNFKKITEMSKEEWNMVLDTNLTGTWLCMKNEIKEMQKNGSGVIINIASISGLKGTANRSAYAAANHGVLGITQTAALEYAEDKIRVNAVCAGIIETHMIENMSLDELKKESNDTPLKRIGQPEEVAELVLYLCSENASFITGQSINIDGGVTAK